MQIRRCKGRFDRHKMEIELERFRGLPEFVTVYEASIKLGINDGNFYQWMKGGCRALPFYRTHKIRFLKTEELIRWLRDRKKLKEWWTITDAQIRETIK